MYFGNQLPPWASMSGGANFWSPQMMQPAMATQGYNTEPGAPQATGANRPGMGYRRERRQAQRAGTYDPNDPSTQAPPGGEIGRGAGPTGQMAPPLMAPQWGMGGGFPMAGLGGWGGGMPWGGGFPQQMMGGEIGRGSGPQMQQMQQAYNPQAAQMSAPQGAPQGMSTRGGYNSAATAPGSETIKGFFNSPFGQLTTASGGNSNVFKAMGGDENTLYNFDPSAGWQQMSQDQYRAGPGNFADPSQFAGAGAVTQQFQRTNVPAHLRGPGFR